MFFFFFLLLFFLVLYLPFLLGRQVFFGVDFSYQNLPAKAFFASTLKSGAIPFWAKELGLGFPLFAEGIVGVFYPFHLLFLIFPLQTAYLLCFGLHLTLLALLSCLFFRSLGISSSLSAAGGFLLGLSQLSLLKWLNFAESLSWLPLLLLLIVGRNRRRSSILLGITLALSYLTSHPQIALLNIVVVAPFLLFSFEPKSCLLRFRTAVLALLIFFALSAFQILPQAELAKESIRAGGLPPSFGMENSLPLPTLLFLFGMFALLPFLLLRRFASARYTIPFFIASTLALLLAAGKNFPFYRFLYFHVPPFGGFTVPSRALGVGSVLFLGSWLLVVNQRLSPAWRKGVSILLCLVSLAFLKGNIGFPVPFRWAAVPHWKLTPEEGGEKLMTFEGTQVYDQVPSFLKKIKEDKTFFRVDGHADGLFRPNLPLLWKVPTLGVYSPLALARKKILLAFDTLSILQLVGAKYLIFPEPLSLSKQKRWQAKQLLEKPIALYELHGSLPRVWSVREVRFYPAERSLLEAMLSQTVSFQRVAFTQSYPLARRAKQLSPAQIGRVLETPNTISIEYQAPGKALLVVNEQSYHGWRAKIDHHVPLSLASVNLLQIAALVPAGRHTLTLTFLPTAFWSLFSLSLILLAICLYLLWRRGRKKAI